MGNAVKQARVRNWVLGGLLGLACGCASTEQTAYDPLIVGRSQEPAATQGAGLYAVPGEPSTAALAVTTRPTLNADTRLAIDGQPKSGSARSTVIPARWTEESATISKEEFSDQLRARGVAWHQLELHDGEWWFRCTVPNPHNPNMSRQYEASSRDELSAVQAAFQRIDADRNATRD